MSIRSIFYDRNIGGLNSRSSEMMLAANESPDLLNVKLTKFGSIAKEKGYTLFNSTAITGTPEVGGIYNYKKSSTGFEYLIVGAGTKLFTAYTGSFTDITRTSSAYTNNKIWDFVTFNDICIAVNGADAPQKYSGGTNAEDLGGSPPTGAAFVEVHKNRVFMAGESANPTKLSYSSLSDPEDWTTASDAGWIEVGLNDGQKITGLKSFYDYLIIFKESSIYVLAGYSGDPTSTDYFSVKPVNANIGAVSNRSIVQVGSEIYFLSSDGVQTLSTVQTYGDLTINALSYKIQSIIDRLNKPELSNSFAIQDFEEDRIWFFVPYGSSTRNDLILIYDYNLKAWTKRSGFKSKCGYMIKNPIGESCTFFTGSYDGYLYHQKQGYSYAGEPISAYYATAWLDLGYFRTRKRVRDIQLLLIPTGGFNLGVSYRWNYGDANTGNINIYLSESASLYSDSTAGDSISTWDTALWDGPSVIKATRSINGGGNVLQLTFWNSTVDESFTILGWYINVIERGIR